MSIITETGQRLQHASATELDAALEKINTRYMEIWLAAAGLKTYGQAVAEVMKSRMDEGEHFDMSVEEWQAFSKPASFSEARERAKPIGLQPGWALQTPR